MEILNKETAVEAAVESVDTAKKPNRKEGLTLLEVLLAVGASFVIMVGGVFIFRNVLSGNDVNSTIRDVSLIQSGVRQLYAQAASYGRNDITNALRDAGALPSSMVTTEGEIRNRFGGNVLVETDGNEFTIEFDGIPSDACVKLVTSTEASTWKMVEANGQSWRDNSGGGRGGRGGGLPPDPVEVAGACSEVGNTIRWTSY